MTFIYEKIDVICKKLLEMTAEDISGVGAIEFAPCEYKEKYENENVPDNSLEWRAFEKGMRVGGKSDTHYWFRFRLKTPEVQEGKECVLSIATGSPDGWAAINPQGLVYLDGKMTQGLDTNHTEVLLEYDREYDVTVYFYTGYFDDLFDFEPKLRLIDKRTEKLYYDLYVPLEAARYIDRDSVEYYSVINTLNEALGLLDMRVPKSREFYESAERVCDYLYEHFYNGICGKGDVTVHCVGHTHIDVAWLWTLAQTREKAQRSFATVINLMKQYPEYKFMSSQPQLYAYVKAAAPELYAEIKKAVKEGRWEVEGAMWLEADCNLISGESLVRQLMFGKRFMREEFGTDSRVLWLPDVFGYSAAMPQILKKSGVEKFVTSKISWNEMNTMPYDVFMWSGIDGSEIFTSFLPARDARPFGESDNDDRYTTYNGHIRPSQVIGTWKRFQQKEYSKQTVITYGYGDGGGGPSKDMLEHQRRMAYGLPGFPKTRQSTVGEYLSALEKSFFESAAKLKRMPRWAGELYLELHRGTYTSMAENKRNNRKSELAYQRLEALAVTDMLTGGEYPQEKINDGWREILLNQFHDIIPGSSIRGVYEDSDRAYERILSNAEKLQKSKLEALKGKLSTEGGLLVYNPNGFEMSGIIKADGHTAYAENIPPFGWSVIENPKCTNSIKASESEIENGFFRIKFENNKIVSIYDKKNRREIVKKDRYANEIRVFEDFPKEYDAWEITNYYKEKMWLVEDIVSQEVISDGVRAGIRQVWKYLDSVIEQKIWLYEDIDRIDFETEADWKQEHMLVKAAFPIDVRADEATYDIQFGSIKRPTHRNTSWDAAKFEVCAHKWADISDNGYGVSLMNDCKYGYSAEGSELSLTLIKCATYPNPDADKCRHSFTYSLYAHSGGVYAADTIKRAYELNQPLIAEEIGRTEGILPEKFSVVGCDCDNIIAETMKKSEDGEDIIIRMYESKNMRTAAKITLGFDFERAYICDLQENEIDELEPKGREISLNFGNFEIITVKIKGGKI